MGSPVRLFKKMICIVVLSLTPVISAAGDVSIVHDDPHYNKIGFFDIHICNWPARPEFFKVLFSTTQYENVESMKVFTSDDTLLVKLDKRKFRTLKRKSKPDKRVFMLEVDVPKKAPSGWYYIKVNMKDGKTYQAKDYVIISIIETAQNLKPTDEDEEIQLPVTLKWSPVLGAQYYQAFVRDVWTGELIYKSKLLSTAETKIPEGLLEACLLYTSDAADEVVPV